MWFDLNATTQFAQIQMKSYVSSTWFKRYTLSNGCQMPLTWCNSVLFIIFLKVFREQVVNLSTFALEAAYPVDVSLQELSSSLLWKINFRFLVLKCLRLIVFHLCIWVEDKCAFASTLIYMMVKIHATI